MRGWASFLAIIALFLSLGTGMLAHATESFGCESTQVSLSAGHVDGDSDQVPADADNGMPHHHGGCHGHHVGTDAPRAQLVSLLSSKGGHLVPRADNLPNRAIDPALRPPIA